MLHATDNSDKPRIIRVDINDHASEPAGFGFRVLSIDYAGLVGVTAGIGGPLTVVGLHEPTDADLIRLRDTIDEYLNRSDRARAKAEVDAILASTTPTVDEVLEQHAARDAARGVPATFEAEEVDDPFAWTMAPAEERFF